MVGAASDIDPYREGHAATIDALRTVVANSSVALLDLLPIPAALVAVRDGKIASVKTNRPYVMAGLGGPATSAVGVRDLEQDILRFVGGKDLRRDFPWQCGTSVDCRYFNVTFSRLDADTRHCLLTLIDQTAELRTEQNLRREMMTDSLSGLLNRAGFSEMLENLLEAPQVDRADYAVLVLDLDRFSRVNACLGSMAGDELLITVARRLRGVLRSGDVLARIGGDEFGLLVKLQGEQGEADQVARRIQDVLAAPFRLSGYEIRVSCSIGIAFGSDVKGDAENFVRQAQFAVKRSKASGAVERYQVDAFDFAREKFGMETALRRAIDRDRLRLAYQPIIDLASGKVVCFEALARWRDDDGQEISPNTFIPVAEESGLIVPLGCWALGEAIWQLSAWDIRSTASHKLRMAVNLSAIQMQRTDIVPVVEEALARNGLMANRLTLELTESAIVLDQERISATMRALKALGATIAMDDFGTGYSNLAYLQRLPIDILKIDRSFVDGMLGDRDKLAIVRAILSLAQALGMKTTAEGIETNEISQTLTALGSTFGQGYLYSRPLEAEDAYAFLIERNS